MHSMFNPTKTSIQHKQYFIFKTMLKQLFVASKLGSYFFSYYTDSFLENFTTYTYLIYVGLCLEDDKNTLFDVSLLFKV